MGGDALERRLIALLTDAGLLLALTNTRVNGHEVDAYCPDHHLILEVDSWLYHGPGIRFIETGRVTRIRSVTGCASSA